jgi:hypothetical protein
VRLWFFLCAWRIAMAIEVKHSPSPELLAGAALAGGNVSALKDWYQILQRNALANQQTAQDTFSMGLQAAIQARGQNVGLLENLMGLHAQQSRANQQAALQARNQNLDAWQAQGRMALAQQGQYVDVYQQQQQQEFQRQQQERAQQQRMELFDYEFTTQQRMEFQRVAAGRDWLRRASAPGGQLYGMEDAQRQVELQFAAREAGIQPQAMPRQSQFPRGRGIGEIWQAQRRYPWGQMNVDMTRNEDGREILTEDWRDIVREASRAYYGARGGRGNAQAAQMRPTDINRIYQDLSREFPDAHPLVIEAELTRRIDVIGRAQARQANGAVNPGFRELAGDTATMVGGAASSMMGGMGAMGSLGIGDDAAFLAQQARPAAPRSRIPPEIQQQLSQLLQPLFPPIETPNFSQVMAESSQARHQADRHMRIVEAAFTIYGPSAQFLPEVIQAGQALAELVRSFRAQSSRANPNRPPVATPPRESQRLDPIELRGPATRLPVEYASPP